MGRRTGTACTGSKGTNSVPFYSKAPSAADTADGMRMGEHNAEPGQPARTPKARRRARFGGHSWPEKRGPRRGVRGVTRRSHRSAPTSESAKSEPVLPAISKSVAVC